MSYAPGRRYQNWFLILLSIFVIFIPTYVTALYASWDWFNSKSWGGFLDHLPFLVSFLYNKVKIFDDGRWSFYVEYLQYHGLSYQLFFHLFIPFVLTLSVAMFLSVWAFWIPGGYEMCNHIKGPTLRFGSDAHRHAKVCFKNEVSSNKTFHPGVFLHPKVQITTGGEKANVGIFGTTGSGKSMIFKALLSFVMKRGDFSIVYDEKGEYTKEFYKKESCFLIAPWDRRGTVWNICEDVRTKGQAILVAECLIPESTDRDQIWVNGARLLLTGMFLTLIASNKAWGWRDIAHLLSVPQDEMAKNLNKHFPIARSFIEENSRTTQGFYVNLIAEVNWLEDLAVAWPEPVQGGFSVKRWILGNLNRKTLLIQAHPLFDSIGAPLCNSIISLATKYLLSADDRVNKNIWLLIDEFGNLPKNPVIFEWLELARSRGARSVLCTQSISQIQERYGDSSKDRILALLSNKVVLRVGSGGGDAEYVSKIFGERVVERPTSNEPNASWMRSSELLVEPSEITQLPTASNKGVEGFLFVPGWNSVYRLRWPLFESEGSNESYVLADWTDSRRFDEKTGELKVNRFRRSAGN